MKTKKTKILCTLGPASFDSKVIKRLEDLGVDLFRINLSHTKIKDLDTIIKEIQRQERRIAEEGGAYANKREELETRKRTLSEIFFLFP